MPARILFGGPPSPLLLRRLMIICPHTGVGVDTGYELTAIPAEALPLVLVDCSECGEDHTWRIEDAFAET